MLSQNYVEMLRGLDVHRFQYVGVATLWVESISDQADFPVSAPCVVSAFNSTDLHKYLGMPPTKVRFGACVSLIVPLPGGGLSQQRCFDG